MNFPKTVIDERMAGSAQDASRPGEATPRQRDALNAARRRLPMVEIEKEYVFEGPEGPRRFLDLFERRHQLIVYHFMFEPGDAPSGKAGEPYDEGCSGCSFIVDNVGQLSHLHARDTSLVLVSRAPLGKLAPFKARMGWKVPCIRPSGVTLQPRFSRYDGRNHRSGVEYNYQDRATLERNGETYHLSGEQPGVSVFLRDDGDRIYHTYSAYGRGMDILDGTYNWLDLTPFGRQEDWEDSPPGWPQTPTHGWLRHHDKYDETNGDSDSCCSPSGQQSVSYA